MITIGLTTWTEHPGLIGGETRKVRLTEYAGFFPLVEVDTSFYGIPSSSTIEKWQSEVPENFQFILKANQLMTRHDEGKEEVDELTRMQAFRDFKKSDSAIGEGGTVENDSLSISAFLHSLGG